MANFRMTHIAALAAGIREGYGRSALASAASQSADQAPSRVVMGHDLSPLNSHDIPRRVSQIIGGDR